MMPSAPPVVQNGALLTMNKPSNPTVTRAFTSVLTGGSRNGRGYPLVNTLGLIGGLPFTVSNPVIGLSAITKLEGQPVLLQGAVVVASDGYTGTVDPSHTAGPTLMIG